MKASMLRCVQGAVMHAMVGWRIQKPFKESHLRNGAPMNPELIDEVDLSVNDKKRRIKTHNGKR